MLLDFTRGHATGIQRNYRFTEVANRGLTLSNDLRLEATIAVTWTFDLHLAEVTTDCFTRSSIAGVATATAFRSVLCIAEVLFHFQLQEGLQRVFHQRLKQLLGVHRLRAAASAHLVH